MRKPQRPPSLNSLLEATTTPRLAELLSVDLVDPRHPYPHWDKLRHRKPPAGFTSEEWWLGLKLARKTSLKPIGLRDSSGSAFLFSVPEPVMQEVHQIDLGAGGLVSMPEQITNPNTRNRYVVSSLIEEAITSSQLEGAVTTRDVARRMIASGRRPRDISERMILNNYVTIQRVRELKNERLSKELVLEIHRLITDGTFDNADAIGRFRSRSEKFVVGDDFGEVFHEPPPAHELEERMMAMCEFANAEAPNSFIHPAVRSIILHFWLAYDHPFIDGNGRTARALFYWSMLRSGYWLFEFISISNILRKAPAQYGRSFLYTETDDNDLTYFLIAQTRVIRRAIASLHAYIERKTAEIREVEAHTRALDLFNHRQVALVSHALKHPGERYFIARHQKMHRVAYQTARTDLLGLVQYGILESRRTGKKTTFVAANDLSNRLLVLSNTNVSV